MFPSPASYLLAPLTPTAFSPESLFVLSSPPLLGDMKLVQVELEQRSLRGDLLDVLHTRIDLESENLGLQCPIASSKGILSGSLYHLKPQLNYMEKWV